MADFIVEFNQVNCASCNISFLITSAMYRRRKDDHETFWCPAGHTNYFPAKNDADLLRDKLGGKEVEIKRLSLEVSMLEHNARILERRCKRKPRTKKRK